MISFTFICFFSWTGCLWNNCELYQVFSKKEILYFNQALSKESWFWLGLYIILKIYCKGRGSGKQRKQNLKIFLSGSVFNIWSICFRTSNFYVFSIGYLTFEVGYLKLHAVDQMISAITLCWDNPIFNREMWWCYKQQALWYPTC